MIPGISLFVFKNKVKKNGDAKIYIRFTNNRRCSYICTNITVPFKYWDVRHQRVKPSYRSANAINMLLERKLSELREQMMVKALHTRHITHKQAKSLAVKKGDVYEFRIWAKTSSQQSISFRMYDSSGKKIYAKRFKVQPGDWELLTDEFTASVTSVNCKIEIIIQDPGHSWIGAVSLMPLNNFHGMRNDVVELLKKL